MEFEYKLPIVVDAEVSPIEDEEEFEQVTASLSTADLSDTILDELSTAAPAPIVDGKPRMLHITAFFVHEGFNNNRDGFVAEELETAVKEKKLFSHGYAGLIDIDHDFDSVGYWYKAEFATDPKTGTEGVLAHGAIWAWRYPEVADRILAQSVRDGHIKVSMAVLAKREDLEFVEHEGRLAKIIHNPVFIGATVLLDKPAGDPDARGVVEEDPNASSVKSRRNMVLKAAAQETDTNDTTEVNMLEDLKPLLADKLGEHSDKVINKISEIVDARMADLRSALDERDDAIATVEAEKEELTTKVSDLETSIEEKDLAVQNLRDEKETLESQVAELEEELEGFRAAEEERAFEAAKAARLEELSESVREHLDEKPEEVREAIVTRWAKLSDEEWETTKEELALVAEAYEGGEETKEDDKRLPGTGEFANLTIDSFLK